MVFLHSFEKVRSLQLLLLVLLFFICTVQSYHLFVKKDVTLIAIGALVNIEDGSVSYDDPANLTYFTHTSVKPERNIPGVKRQGISYTDIAKKNFTTMSSTSFAFYEFASDMEQFFTSLQVSNSLFVLWLTVCLVQHILWKIKTTKPTEKRYDGMWWLWVGLCGTGWIPFRLWLQCLSNVEKQSAQIRQLYQLKDSVPVLGNIQFGDLCVAHLACMCFYLAYILTSIATFSCDMKNQKMVNTEQKNK